MGDVVYYLRMSIELFLRVFDFMPPWLGLTLFSFVSGVGMLWVFGKTTPQSRLERARDQMLACFFELRLFFDSPRRVIAAQARLLWYSTLYTIYMLPAFVVLGIPMTWMFLHLEVRYAYGPLPTNEAIVVSVELDDGVDGSKIVPAADQPEGVEVTAPPLWVEDEGTVFIRVQLTAETATELVLDADGTDVRKRLDGDPESLKKSPDRGSGLAMFWVFTDEDVIDSDAGISWIEVAQPRIEERWFGLPMPWWVAWLILATFSAFGMRKRLGVVL